MELTHFDTAVLIVVGLSTLIGVIRGFLREILSLFGWAVAAAAAYFFYPYGAELVKPTLDGTFANLAGAVGIFFVALIVWSLFSFLIIRLIKLADIGPIDRSLGFGFGLARGALMVSVGYLMLSLFYSKDTMPDWIKNAKTHRLAEIGAGMIEDAAPELIEKSRGSISNAMKKDNGNALENALTRQKGRSVALQQRPEDNITEVLKREKFQDKLNPRQIDTLSSVIDSIPDSLGIDTNPDLSRFSDRQSADYFLQLLNVYRDLKTQNQVAMPKYGDTSDSGLDSLEKALTTLSTSETPKAP